MVRVLIVDDLEEMRVLSSSHLNHLGIETVTMNGAQEALETLAEDSAFDAIFSDYLMPHMSGVEFIEHVKLLYPNIPVVMIASYIDPTIKREAVEKGAALVMDKPYSNDHYVQALKAIRLM